jgi:hypothetical protein
MRIPKFWASATGSEHNPRGQQVPLKCFGHSDTGVNEARSMARNVLARLSARVRSGEPFPQRYTYADRPIREEILRELHAPGGELEAYVTRNSYGADILNSARVLFADIDDPRSGLGDLVRRLRRWLRPRSSAAEILRGLPPSITTFCAARPSWGLRVYRTHAGWRVLAVHDLFDPTSEATLTALRELGSDPKYVQLTKAQECFRARLTPKPWRCGVSRPNSEYPREDPVLAEQHGNWLRSYAAAIQPYATCHFVTAVGRGRPCEPAERLTRLHDDATRATSSLPLA